MRAILPVVALLFAARPAVAEETWVPISADGVEYEVRLPLATDGLQTYRMPPGRLEETLQSLGGRASRLATDLEGANLPSAVAGAPDLLFAEVAAAARAMGPDLRFSSPPRLRDAIAEFSFNDGERLVSFAVSSPDADIGSQQVDVVYRERVAGEWQVERRQTLLLDREDRRPGSRWRRASYGESLGSAQRPQVDLTYVALEERGQWFGSELRRGQRGRRFVLRSLDPRSGDPVVSRVARPVASRLARRTFRLLAASSPRVALRQIGVTYVRGTAGRKAYLRRLPARQPRARR